MKTFVIIAIFLCLCLSGFAQSTEFEGYIIYRYSYFNPEGEDITEKMMVDNDSVQHYYINRENYISFGQSQDFQQLYNSSTNRYFYLNNGKIMYLDAAISSGQNPKFENLTEEKTILGKLCRGVELKNGEDSTIYFYSDEIRVNPEPFKNHNLGDFGPYLKETGGALSLQIISKSTEYTMVMTAEFIQEMNLPQDGFDIELLIKR
jgi:hypothetical protein